MELGILWGQQDGPCSPLCLEQEAGREGWREMVSQSCYLCPFGYHLSSLTRTEPLQKQGACLSCSPQCWFVLDTQETFVERMNECVTGWFFFPTTVSQPHSPGTRVDLR